MRYVENEMQELVAQVAERLAASGFEVYFAHGALASEQVATALDVKALLLLEEPFKGFELVAIAPFYILQVAQRNDEEDYHSPLCASGWQCWLENVRAWVFEIRVRRRGKGFAVQWRSNCHAKWCDMAPEGYSLPAFFPGSGVTEDELFGLREIEFCEVDVDPVSGERILSASSWPETWVCIEPGDSQDATFLPKGLVSRYEAEGVVFPKNTDADFAYMSGQVHG